MTGVRHTIHDELIDIPLKAAFDWANLSALWPGVMAAAGACIALLTCVNGNMKSSPMHFLPFVAVSGRAVQRQRLLGSPSPTLASWFVQWPFTRWS